MTERNVYTFAMPAAPVPGWLMRLVKARQQENRDGQVTDEPPADGPARVPSTAIGPDR